MLLKHFKGCAKPNKVLIMISKRGPNGQGLWSAREIRSTCDI